MIRSFRIINDTGKSLDIDIRKPEETGFLVSSVIGLTFPSADISVAEYPAFDGAIFGNNRIPQRNIVMQLIFYINNIEGATIEQLRLKCDKYFPTKEYITFCVENDSGFYKINGYVESNNANIFSDKEGASISIICDDPYFIKEDDYVLEYVSKNVPGFSFPCSFEYDEEQAIYLVKYILTRTENEYAETGLITGVNEEKEPVDISIEDRTLELNEAGGFELTILPDEIHYDAEPT